MRDKILAMEAGEEIDDLIATKIMNWNAKSKLFGEEYEDYWHDGKKFVFECASFKPSSDISAAWEVVEKMHDWGGCEIGCYGKGEYKWFLVSTTSEKWGSVMHTANNAPEAICKAALLSVMES